MEKQENHHIFPACARVSWFGFIIENATYSIFEREQADSHVTSQHNTKYINAQKCFHYLLRVYV